VTNRKTRAAAQRWSIAGVLAVAIAASLAGAARPASAPAGWIVFGASSQAETQANQLFRIKVSGEGLQKLTKGNRPSIAPAVSPDGKRIAFARGGIGIMSMNLDGTGLRRLTSNSRDSYPAWSPDSQRVAFLRPYKGAWRVFTMSAAGGGQRMLPKSPPACRPTWTKSGLLIPSGGDLVKIDSTTGKILKYYGAEIDPIWGVNQTSVSPATTTVISIGSRRSDPGDMDCGEGPCQRFALYIEDIRKSGSRPRLLLRDVGPATFSPEGQRLLFVAKGGLVVWTLASGTSRVISTGDAYPTVATPPSWR
jgi:dipeptidyl aminopeptidase/acylaminoacyl peptidase